MRYEVEMKFPVADMAAIERRLEQVGAAILTPYSEVDTYFAHPVRDFAETDEALRIRRRGESNFVTYKGPKIDQTTKTRREIDLPVATGEASAQAWTELLQALGFVIVGEVRKHRRKAHVAWHSHCVEVSLDQVDQFGTFVELELLTDEAGMDAARTCIASLASELQLGQSERRSYLELLLGHSGLREQSLGA